MGAPQSELQKRSAVLAEQGKKQGILDHARVYLSGPMDFVKDRGMEERNGWRTRISQFMTSLGTTVFDPWNKPQAMGMGHYGEEDEFTVNRRDLWSYEGEDGGDRIRGELCSEFWPTLHIDLRMTDLADFLIAYCPTNIYSVGTVHEIATARLQHKPVLLVTPYLELEETPAALQQHLEKQDDEEGQRLLGRLLGESPRRSNTGAAPSLWYMAMLEHEDYFFDGFGFEPYMERMGWTYYPDLDDREHKRPPKRPLLPYLESLNREIPKRFDVDLGRDVENPEWLIFADTDLVDRPERD